MSNKEPVATSKGSDRTAFGLAQSALSPFQQQGAEFPGAISRIRDRFAPGVRRPRVLNMRNDYDEAETLYDRLVVRARASERMTPEGLEQVYAMSVLVSDIEIA
jgi:hypothetical protein